MSQAGNIRVNPAELRTLAAQIGEQKTALQTQFSDINREMLSLENDGWDSESGRELRRRFTSLRNFFDQNYPPAMQEYIDFLNRTADNYEEEERARKRDIQGLREYV